MIDKLKLFFRRYSPPFFYSFARHCYWKIRQLTVIMLGTKIEERRWANRSFEEIQKGFTNLNHPHRQLLLKKIGALYPISSILEIGCGYGPNLYLIAKQFPKIELVGIDINPLSIREGNKLLTKDRISNVKLMYGKADELHQFRNKNFDILFTDALLMFIGPDKIKKVMGEMFRITRRALILVEWHCKSQNKDPYGLGVYYLDCWKRNYIDLLKEFTLKDRIRLTKIPNKLWPEKNWQELGYLIEVIL